MGATAVQTSEPTASLEMPALTAGNLHVDLEQYQAFISGTPVELTYQEFELLRLLVAGRDRILSFDDLIEQLWNGSTVGTRRRLGVVICRLRAKLRGSSPYRVQTVRGRGYGLTLSAREARAMIGSPRGPQGVGRALLAAAMLSAALVRAIFPFGGSQGAGGSLDSLRLSFPSQALLQPVSAFAPSRRSALSFASGGNERTHQNE